MPLLGLLESLDPLIVINTLALAHLSKHVLDSRHHSLESTEVHVSTSLKLFEDLIGVLLDLVLDVHLASVLVESALSGQGVVDTEVVGVAGLGFLELVIIEKGVAVGNAEEEPGLTLVDGGGGGVLVEETTDESAEGRIPVPVATMM